MVNKVFTNAGLQRKRAPFGRPLPAIIVLLVA
jgi:hypothetical protein